MGRKGLSAALVVTGSSLVALSVAADAIGIGGDYAFGWEQKIGVAVGMTVAWFSSLALLGWNPRSQRRAARAATPHAAAPVSV
jgi:hypothetical protein